MSNHFRRSNVKYAILGLIAVLLVSCARVAEQSTPTFSPTKTVTIEPSSTETPVPVVSPTPTIVPTLPSYSLPSWMGNPSSASILAAFITDDSADSPKISFYNAATGEKYDVNIPNDVRGYFWYDSNHFGFLSNDLKSIKLIDLTTGQISENSLAPESLRLWNIEHENYLISGRELVALEIIHKPNGEILLEQVGWDWNNKSKSKQFAAEWNSDSRNKVTIIDTVDKQTIWEVSLQKDFYGTEFAWSPTDENRLAFIQGKPIPYNDVEMTSITLTIVDVAQKKTLWTYDGDFGRMVWSPDGKKILYQNNASRFGGYGVGFQDAPCILFIETGVKRCLRSIPRFVPSGFVLGTTGRYTWGTDNESIFYLYLYYPLSGKYDETTGNLCIYSLKDGHIRCPTQNLPILGNGNSIVSYDISPNQQFIHFCYSDSTILNDYAGNSSDAIIDMNGNGFFSWVGNSANIPPSCSDKLLWRPLQK